jgi:integration host factor subunit beta
LPSVPTKVNLLPGGDETGHGRRQKEPGMTKKEMTRKIAERLGISQGLALEAVQMVFDGITETLVAEGRIQLRNFGVFEVKRRRARKARNPRTGESVSVPERTVVTFKAGREMEERVGQLKQVPNAEA